ncbi:MAG: NAD(P)-dependent oxidoreductase, partial [Candidatus Limnocylindrales bacterium]
ERALLRALREGPMRGAVLDAFRDEPLPPDSPLYEVPNLIVTPHTSWTSGRVLDRSIELFCENLVRFRNGEPLENVVNPSIGY